MWIKDSSITFEPSLQEETLTIYMENLSLGRLNWSFKNLNLQISRCLLPTANLIINEKFSNENYSNAYGALNVAIDDSSLGYLRADNVSQIRIRNSDISGRHTERDSSFFVLLNSNLVMSNSTFTNNIVTFNSTKPTLLNASTNSNISFVNCILSGNIGYVSIVQVTNSSSLNLINSDISYNKIFNESSQRSIFIINESFVSVANCTITHNELVTPKNGGAVFWITFFSRICLENCIITKNQGISLFLQYAVDEGKLNITNCYIAENNSPRGISSTFLLQGVSGGAYYLMNCTFVKNYADDGGAVNGEASIFHFKDCVFKENKASTGGVADIGGQVYFENCEFYANEGTLQAGAIMDQVVGSRVVIHNCLFRDNRGISSTGALSIVFGSELSVSRSIFINNTSENRAGAILLQEV